MLPSGSFDGSRLQKIDAEVDLVAKRLKVLVNLPLESLRASLRLNDSILKLAPLEFGFAGGPAHVAGNAGRTAADDCYRSFGQYAARSGGAAGATQRRHCERRRLVGSHGTAQGPGQLDCRCCRKSQWKHLRRRGERQFLQSAGRRQRAQWRQGTGATGGGRPGTSR